MIIEKFEQQVEKFAQKTAVVTETGKLTYARLNDYANGTASEILARKPGRGKQQVVGLLFEHGAGMIAGVLGTLKAEEIYVPLDITYPENRLAYMLEDSEAYLVLTNTVNMPLAEKLAAKVDRDLKILNIEKIDNKAPSANIKRNPSGDKLAYILYTSGSTGRPKGVIQNHENVCYYIENWTARFSIGTSDRMTLFSAFSHDGAGQDMFGALHNGAILYPYNILNRADIAELSKWLIEEKITIWHSVPTLYRYFVNTLKDRDIARGHFPDLRFVLLGGEQIRGHDIDMYKTFFPHVLLANVYGQTESSVSTIRTIKAADTVNKMLIGEPLDKTKIFIVSENGEIVEKLGVGEIYVSCPHLALGYWKDKERSEEVFLHDPELGRLYRTGDLGRLLTGGGIEFMGRKDAQVKIRGFRVEMGEIESVLLSHEAIKEAVVAAKTDKNGNDHLCAYIVTPPPPAAAGQGDEFPFTVSELRQYLTRELPEHMIPSYFIRLPKLPLTPNGKVDRKQLPEPEPIRPKLSVTYVAPGTGIEKKITAIWEEVLNLDKVGIDDNFFDLGGTSLDIMQVMTKLHGVFQKDIPVVSLFRYPTIRSFVTYLMPELGEETTGIEAEPRAGENTGIPGKKASGIAVIGMSCRFSASKNIHRFWENLVDGVESISFFAKEELEEVGVGPSLLDQSIYVKAKGILDDLEYFDAAFFNYTPTEAEVLDPQLRVLHECSYEALENAGYDSGTYDGSIGLYAGNASNHYWIGLTYLHDKRTTETGFLTNNYTTIVSYKLNLKGPSFSLQCACSTSLVAIHLASRALLAGECVMALAGGVSIWYPNKNGYIYEEGMMYSRDGHCRTFDAKANGTIFCNGGGMVLLKRLEDAAADGDNIWAVMKGSGVNNDGRRKVGLASPSIDGQAEIIAKVYRETGIDPETISYVEAHGTGTILGDPVELEALKLAYNTGKKGYCRIGSVKTNIGHLNVAAGVAGFIKTVLALKHKLIPASLNYETPNPKIDFETSPFVVNSRLTEWKRNGGPLRAGVSSFGIGGTNAHAILEEAPERPPSSQGRKLKMLVLSAASAPALEEMTRNLGNYLKENRDIHLADAAYTLQVGRKACKLRKLLLCSGSDEAVKLLLDPEEPLTPETGKLHAVGPGEDNRRVVFMFSGQGAQYAGMGLELYRTEPVFRLVMDRCFEILKSLTDYDVKEILYPGKEDAKNTGEHEGIGGAKINQTEITQPVIFIIEYALARLLMGWGIKPYAMIGHSIGEYTAACLSGVLSLEDALALVALRGRLMQTLPAGSMLSVPLPEAELKPLLKENGGLSLAAVNTTAYCVVSGPHDAVDGFEKQLKEKGIDCRRLHTSHAFHSAMMAPILKKFTEKAREVPLNNPLIPYISNVTGKWITVEDATDPAYWAKHVRQTIRFADGLSELLKESDTIFLEVGPGRTLNTFVSQHKERKPDQSNLNLIRHPREDISDTYYLLSRIGRLWLKGKKIDWQGFYASERRHRVPLPTYPFQRQRYYLEGNPFAMGSEMLFAERPPEGKKTDISEWFYIPSWKSSLPPARKTGKPVKKSLYWLLFIDECEIGPQLADRLKAKGHDVVIVRPGSEFTAPGDNETADNHKEYRVNPSRADDYRELLRECGKEEKIPNRIVHLWNVTAGGTAGDQVQALGFYSLLYLAQAIGNQPVKVKEKIQLSVVTNGMQAAAGNGMVSPQKATAAGAVQVIPREYANIACRSIDFPAGGDEKLTGHLWKELSADINGREPFVAYRYNQRWVKTYQPYPLESPGEDVPRLKQGGIYLVTGGLGGIGLVIAGYLAQNFKAKLILTGRTPLPAREEWQEWLDSHDEQDSIGRKIRDLRQLEKSGAEVMVIAADAADRRQMEKGIRGAEKRFGKINGVIHSAGVADGALIQLRTKEMSEKVLAPKIEGTLVLDALLKDTPLDFFILCSSISAVTAPLGQAAYCAANNFLDHFARYKTARDKTFTLSVNWDAWREVGMAVAAAKQLSKPASTTRVLPVDHPLFDRCEIIGPGQSVYISHLTPARDWVLSEHRIEGKAALPGTSYLEMARAAVVHHYHNGNSRVELSEFLSLTPLAVGDDEEKEMRFILKKETGKNGGYTFSFVSRATPGEDGWLEHARGKASVLAEEETKRFNVKEIEETCSGQEKIYNREAFDGRQGFLTFGPRWNNLERIKSAAGQALGFLELPGPFAADLDSYKLHPALLDVGNTVLKRTYSDGNSYLPMFYKRVRIKRDLPPKVFFHVKNAAENKRSAETLRYNIVIMDEQGVELVDIEDYTLKMVKTDSYGVEQFRDGEGREGDQTPVSRNQDRRLRPFSSFVSIETTKTGGSGTPGDLLKDAISPLEGIDVFTRILGAEGLTQAVVSTTDLFGRIKKDRGDGGGSPRKRRAQQLEDARPAIVKHARPALSTDYTPPGTGIEKRLAPIWEELLGIEQVGIYDDFFELGGDSLKAVNFGSRIQQELGTEVPISEFFNRPNIKMLAQYIASISVSPLDAAETPDAVEKKEYYRLSPAQERLHVLYRLAPQDTGYNLARGIELIGDSDKEEVTEAIKTLIKMHESLRTSFHVINGKPIQKVHEDTGFELQYYDLTADRGGGRKEIIVKTLVRPFDLEKPPLLRVALVKAAEKKYIMMMDIHHIITDAHSLLVIFQRDFLTLQEGGQLSPLRLQYKDFSAWKNRLKKSAAVKKQEEFWLEEFKGGVPVLDLPLDYERPERQSFKGDWVIFRFGAPEAKAFRKLIREEEATLFMGLLAIYNILLSRLSGQDDIVVGTTVAGRSHPALQSIMGMFVNIVVLRNFPTGEKTFSQFLKELKNRTIKAFENQDYQFEELVETLPFAKKPGRNPLFDVSISLQSTAEKVIDMTGKEEDFLDIETGASKFELGLEVIEIGDMLHCKFEYQEKLFKRETIERFVTYFKEIVSAVAKNKNLRLQDITFAHDLLEPTTTAPEMEFKF